MSTKLKEGQKQLLKGAQIVVESPCTAALYVSGGVPKNYINDSIIMSYIFERKDGGHRYALQMSTAVTQDGGLSSSTLDEAKSWGKIKVDASRAMAWVEPTVALPLFEGGWEQWCSFLNLVDDC